MKRFWVIEWVDGEGDQNVKHLLLEPGEASALMDEFARNGMRATMRDLTQDAPVMSEDEVPRLEN